MANLACGVQAFDRLRHHMGGGVPEGFFAVLVVEGADFQLAVLGDGGAQIGDLAVDSAAAGRFGKAAPRDLATSMTETPASNSLTLPSLRVIWIIDNFLL